MAFWKKTEREREKKETESERDFQWRQGENAHLICGKCQLQIP